MIIEGLRLTNDYVFKKIFEDEQILCDFVSAVIDEHIVLLEIRNSELLPPYVGDKLGRLDILAETEAGEKVNVEMQLVYRAGFDERASFYGMRLHASQMKEGGKFRDMKRTIIIDILDFEHPRLKGRGDFHTEFKLRTPDGAVTLTDKFVVHFVEVPKIPQEIVENLSKLSKWVLFLSNRGGSDMIKVLEREPMIARALTVADLIAKDERERMIAQAREDAIRDQLWIETASYDEAMEQGVAFGEARGKAEMIHRLAGLSLPLSQIAQAAQMSEQEIRSILKKEVSQ